MRDAKLVIMDEPTAALGVTQTAQVLSLIRTLASRGIAVLVISHNLTDVFEVADRIAIMYLGTLVSSGPRSNYDTASASPPDFIDILALTVVDAALDHRKSTTG